MRPTNGDLHFLLLLASAALVFGLLIGVMVQVNELEDRQRLMLNNQAAILEELRSE